MNDVETIRPPFDPAVLYKALFLAVMATFVLVPRGTQGQPLS